MCVLGVAGLLPFSRTCVYGVSLDHVRFLRSLLCILSGLGFSLLTITSRICADGVALDLVPFLHPLLYILSGPGFLSANPYTHDSYRDILIDYMHTQ